MRMSLILLLAAGAALPLAACSGKTDNDAMAMVNSAANDMDDHIETSTAAVRANAGRADDTFGNGLDAAGDAIGNAAGDVAHATGTALDRTGDALHNTAEQARR